jgi:hypothetical protein
MRSKGKRTTTNPPSKKPEKDVNKADSGIRDSHTQDGQNATARCQEACEHSLYKVVSVSEPKPGLAEDFSSTSIPIPYYRRNATAPKAQLPRAESINQSREIIPPIRDQNHRNLVSTHKSKQDASVEARMSLDLGMDAMTQTDDIASSAKEPADCARSSDRSPSERMYSDRLDSLSRELSEIRSLLEQVRCR